MKSFVLATAVAASALSVTSSAFAQCAFDGPGKAKGMKTSMIRAFDNCPSSFITFPYPNSQTGTGVPTCEPPFAFSDYEFHDRKGACTFSSKTKIEEGCPNLSPECMVMTMKLKCTGVMDPGGATPTSDPGFALNLILRATLNDEDNGDMATITFPALIPLQANGGKLGFPTPTQPLSFGLFADFPPCTSLEVIRLTIQDPDGQPFARIGAGTR